MTAPELNFSCYDNLPTALLVVQQLQVIYANPEYYSVYKQVPVGVVGKNIGSILCADIEHLLSTDFLPHAPNGITKRYVVPLRGSKPDGSLVECRVKQLVDTPDCLLVAMSSPNHSICFNHHCSSDGGASHGALDYNKIVTDCSLIIKAIESPAAVLWIAEGVAEVEVELANPAFIRLFFRLIKNKNNVLQNDNLSQKILITHQKKIRQRFTITLPADADHEKHWEVVVSNIGDNRVLFLGFDISSTIRGAIIAQENENKLTAIFNQTFQFAGLLTTDGTVIGVNKTAMELVGARESDVRGKPFWECPWWTHSPSEQALLQQAIQRARAGEVVRFEASHFDAAGKLHYVDFSIKPVYDSVGKLLYLLPEGRDISEHIQLLNALTDREMQLKVAQSIAHLGNWEINITTRELYLSGEALKLLGATDKTLPPYLESYMRYIHPDDREKVSNSFMGTYDDKIDFDITFRIFHSGKRIRYINSKGKYLPATHRKAARIIGTVMDMTERMKAEQELKKHKEKLEFLVRERTNEIHQINEEMASTNEELTVTNDELYSKNEVITQTLEKLKETQSKLIQSEKMASLGVLTAGIAHEINNPINFISSGMTGLKECLTDITDLLQAYRSVDISALPEAELIKEKEEEAEIEFLLQAVEQMTGNIDTGIKRTVDIVKSLRTFTRSEADRFMLTNLHESIDSTLVMLYHQYKNRITVTKIYGKIQPINCIPGKINQVLMNILANAIQAITGEGEITIETSMRGTDGILLSIKDSGAGIPVDVQDKIFDPFFTTKDVGKGTGLGLSISYNIIEQHKGKIEFESTPGVGTTFLIELPGNDDLIQD